MVTLSGPRVFDGVCGDVSDQIFFLVGIGKVLWHCTARNNYATCMYNIIYIYIHTHIYIYIQIYIYIYTYIYNDIHTHIYIYIYIILDVSRKCMWYTLIYSICLKDIANRRPWKAWGRAHFGHVPSKRLCRKGGTWKAITDIWCYSHEQYLRIAKQVAVQHCFLYITIILEEYLYKPCHICRCLQQTPKPSVLSYQPTGCWIRRVNIRAKQRYPYEELRYEFPNRMIGCLVEWCMVKFVLMAYSQATHAWFFQNWRDTLYTVFTCFHLIFHRRFQHVSSLIFPLNHLKPRQWDSIATYYDWYYIPLNVILMSLHIPLKASNFGHHCAIIIASTGTVLRVNQPGPEGVLSTRVARVPIKPRCGRHRGRHQGINGSNGLVEGKILNGILDVPFHQSIMVPVMD